MTRQDLCLLVAEELTVNNKDADRAITAVFTSIKRALEQGEDVRLRGFGNFELHQLPERRYLFLMNNPDITVKSHMTISFKPCKALRQSVRTFDEEGGKK